MATVTATAALSGTGTLITYAQGGPSLAALWSAYLTASNTAAQLNINWKQIKSIARTDGTSGVIYAQLYAAQQAADNAYEAWLTAYRIWYPAVHS